MTTVRVRPEAELDMFEAALWYEAERPGLGPAFLQAARFILGRIEEGPRQFPVVLADIRRAVLSRFPFGIFFVLEDDLATVLAVTHLHRHPSAWEGRR
jgi:toxin ParE1/3/4